MGDSLNDVSLPDNRRGWSGLNDFAVKLADQCQTHTQWLAVVRYGLGTLLQNQPLLLQIIDQEARCEYQRGDTNHATLLPRIFSELGLKIVVNDDKEG